MLKTTIIILFFSLLKCANCCLVRSLTFKLYDKFGFANEIAYLLLAASYARQTNRIFLIDSSNWNYGNFADYFEITEPTDSYLINAPKVKAIFSPDTENHNCHILTMRGGWGKLRGWRNLFPTSFWDREKRLMAKKYLKLTPFAEKEISKILTNSGINSMQFKPDLAFHIRRGDKVTEAKPIPVKKYLQAAHKYIKTNGILKKLKIDNKKRKLRVFIASDDKKVPLEIASARRTWQIYHIKSSQIPNDSGHDQGTFNRLTAKQRINETLAFLADIKLLSNSDYFICTYSSNVARLTYTLRDGPNNILSLDKRYWFPE